MNDYVYGAVSGVFQTIIGHPFDTNKVLLQNGKRLRFNHKALMAGIKYPIATSSLICSINFGTYNSLHERDISIPISGFLSGVIVTPLVFVTDVGKVKKQIGYPIDWVKVAMMKQPGIWSTLWREAFAFSIYFWSFDYSKNVLGIHPFFAGAIAGLSNWTLTYPMDVIRSRQLAEDKTMVDSFKDGKLWRGFGICAVRAVLVNSVGFYVYDYMKENC